MIAFLGVRSQLKQNQEWKTKEHDLNLKKDVYLASAEALHEAINSIHNFPNISLPEEAITANFKQREPALSKTLLICDLDLRVAINDFNKEYGVSTLRLLEARQPAEKLRREAQFKENLIDKFIQDEEYLLSMKKNYTLENIQDPPQWKAIQKQDSFINFQIEKLEKDLLLINEQLRSLQRNIFIMSRSEAANLRRLVIPVLKSARLELGLNLDVQLEKKRLEQIFEYEDDSFNKIFELNISRARSNLENSDSL